MVCENVDIFIVYKFLQFHATMKKTWSQTPVCVHCFNEGLNAMVGITEKYCTLHLLATLRVGHSQFSHIGFLLPAIYHHVTS